MASARGFMFALGCIQALKCNKNTCHTGITTHDTHLQQGLDPLDVLYPVPEVLTECRREFSETNSDVFLHGNVNFNVWFKLTLDYLTPIIVSNAGLLSREPIV